MRSIRDPLRGKTLRWTFDDGPTAGVTYEHRFRSGGVVQYRQAGDRKAHQANYEIAKAGNSVVAVSYLSESGFTLTSVLDLRTGTVAAFASNEDQLVLQHGTFQVAEPGRRPARRARPGRSLRRRVAVAPQSP